DVGDEVKNKEFLEMFTGIADEVKLEQEMNWNDDFEGTVSGRDKDDILSTKLFDNKKCCCPSPFYILIIHSDLNVSVCCVDWNKKLVVGNLREQTLKEIWN